MSDRVFLDTNVIVYLFDGRFPDKQRGAGELLQKLSADGAVPVISTQVLQEAYSALTRKLKMDPREAMATLQMMDGASFQIENVDAAMVWRGAALAHQNQVSFWDAMIIESARNAQCAILYTEDLQDGRVFDGVTVRNPFR